jgi:DNA-directed RNA polymerase specialized sigma24 family protein
VARASRGVVGKAARGVIAEIDERLKSLDDQLARHDELSGERERLRAARATLLGESAIKHITQDDVAAYLAENPGSKPRQIADAFGVPSGRVSAHLYRAKTTRFMSRPDGWYLREKSGDAAMRAAREP